MPMPSIIVNFQKAAVQTASKAGARSVATVVKDDGATEGYYLLGELDDAPAGLSQTNLDHIARIFEGSINRPSEVHLAVIPSADSDYTDAFALLQTHAFDWFVPGPEAESAIMTAAKTWALGLRTNDNMPAKCVLSDTTADSPYMVNFTTDGIKAGSKTYTTAQYAGRIAGIIAGTPLDRSATYITLEEVEDVTRLSKEDQDEAVDEGQYILFYDGVKVKTGRAVTSLTTTTSTPEDLKKIKIVEIIDMIQTELTRLMQDNYIGTLPNTYDNKQVLVTAVLTYLRGLEDYGILAAGESTAEIDVAATRQYLKEEGMDVSKMTEDEIRTADTGTHVFILATIRILDAIEDIQINVYY